MLTAKATPCTGNGSHWLIALERFRARAIVDAGGERIRIDDHGRSVRLDVVEGTLLAGGASLSVEIMLDPRLSAQMAALGEFRGLLAGRPRAASLSAKLRDHLLAIAAHDRRTDGVSLRTLADSLLGPGDWPGDGEYRKSRVRRLIAHGAALIRAGPRAILR